MFVLNNLKNMVVSLKGDIPQRGPDFFVVGATRAGTTYLHHLLDNHPEVFMPKNKELHYFNHDGRYKKNLHGYLPLFNGYKGERVVGEATPLYCEKGTYYDPQGNIHFFREETSIKRIKRHFPDAKLIVSLRDPLSRIRSLHTKNFYQKKIETTLSEEIQRELDGTSRLHLLYRNRYDIHLEEIFKYFPRESVYIMVFEEWIKEANTALNHLSGFLGITQLEQWPEMPEKKNTAEEYKKIDGNKITSATFEMSRNLEKLIFEELKPSRQYVEKLIGRELPWKNIF
jgi:hypothetical protein